MNYMTGPEMQTIVNLLDYFNTESPTEISIEIVMHDVNGEAIGKIAMSANREYAFFPSQEDEDGF